MTEFVPNNPKFKLRESTKRLFGRDFIPVKNEEEMKEEEEKRKTSRVLNAEEIEKEM
jgi:hypothetical protein